MGEKFIKFLLYPNITGDNELIISIASGKGGTGKTLVATSLAASLDRVQLVDCDVEEPNAYLFFPERSL